jgi:excisionase family DNA binding protein
MRLDPGELDALADDLTRRLVPLLLAAIREQLGPAGDDGGLVGIAELAGRIGLSAGSIRARVKDGSLPCVRIGRRVLFDAAAVLATLRDQTGAK